jgi:hypothetical protein
MINNKRIIWAVALNLHCYHPSPFRVSSGDTRYNKEHNESGLSPSSRKQNAPCGTGHTGNKPASLAWHPGALSARKLNRIMSWFIPVNACFEMHCLSVYIYTRPNVWGYTMHIAIIQVGFLAVTLLVIAFTMYSEAAAASTYHTYEMGCTKAGHRKRKEKGVVRRY